MDPDSLKSKADKLLGLEEDTSKITVQKSGWLQRKTPRSLSWKRRYCIVKDGFFLWYLQRNVDLIFDTHPRGAFPLGGAVFVRDEKDSKLIHCTHPDIENCQFKLRAESGGEAKEWMIAFESGKKATWENALLGDALIEKMQTQGTQLESEKEKAFQLMQERARKLESERELAEKIRQREVERQEAYMAKLESEKAKRVEMQGRRSQVESELSREELERKQILKQREEMELRLAQAEDALVKLEGAMVVKTSKALLPQFSKENEDVKTSVNALRSFFEARAKDQAIRAKAIYERVT